jgi:DNA-binding response OmpR family regulator
LLSKPQTILLVDDEPMVLDLIGTVLDREGYRVLRTEDPTAALQLATGRDGGPDLLLTDVTMPALNGPGLANAIRSTHPATKILFMTAHSANGDLDYGIPHDADVIRKPFRIGELVERVRLALEVRTSAATC